MTGHRRGKFKKENNGATSGGQSEAGRVLRVAHLPLIYDETWVSSDSTAGEAGFWVSRCLT